MLRNAALFGLAALGLVAWISRRPTDAGTAPAATAQPVVLSDCRVKLIDEVQLASQQAGVLDFVAHEGELVENNQVVAHVQDALVRATLAIVSRQAENDVEIRFARKATELRQVQYERDLEANRAAPGTVPELTLRENRLAVEKSLLQLEQAETTLAVERLRRRETEERLKLHSVHAPFPAVVRTVFKRRGEAVQEGEPIVELVNTQRVRVEGYVKVSDLSQVAVGAAVSVRLNVPEAELPEEQSTFHGQVAFVDVKVEPVSHLVKVWADVENRDNVLKDGLTATMIIAPR